MDMYMYMYVHPKFFPHKINAVLIKTRKYRINNNFFKNSYIMNHTLK